MAHPLKIYICIKIMFIFNKLHINIFGLFLLSYHLQAFSEISGIITMYYVVRALSPYTEYEFYVIAVNNIGRGPPSIPATCTTGETSKYTIFTKYKMRHFFYKLKVNVVKLLGIFL